MPTPPRKAVVDKQMQAVSAKLESAKLTQRKRLDLLRQQAELGDQRDDAIRAARRAASDR